MRGLFRLGALILLTCGRPADAAPPPKVPVTAFAAIPPFVGPALSPDGSMIAAKVDYQGEQVFMIRSLQGASKSRVIRLGEAEIDGWQWVNNEWLVATFITEDKSLGEPIKVARLAGIGVNGQIIPRKTFFDRVIWVAKDGSPHVKFVGRSNLLEKETAVVTWDVSTGKIVDRAPSYADAHYWWTDEAGTVRVGFGERNTLYYRRTADSKFGRLNLKRLEDIGDVVGMDKGDTLFVLSEQDGHNALWEMIFKNRR